MSLRFFEVVNANLIKFVDYDELNNNLLNELNKNNINKVIMTDLSIGDISFIKKLEEFSSILIIDHHIFQEDLNSEKTTFMNSRDYCASYISYCLFSKIKNLEKIDWLVALASVSDWL